MLRKQARVFKNQNLVADFFRGNAELGDIYQLDDRGWIVITNLFRLKPDLVLEEYLLKAGPKKDISFTKETGTEVKFTGKGTMGEIGSVEAEIKFGGKNSAFVALKQAYWQNLDLVKLKPIIDGVWKQNGYDKRRQRYFFVNQVCTAQSGVVIFSQEQNNVVKIQGKTNQVLESMSIVAEANIEIIANKKETMEIITISEHQPLFQAVSKRANGAWEILG
jgi:hypothetical protein